MKIIRNFLFNKKDCDAHFLAFFRVCIGLFCLLHFLSIYQDFELLYGDSGIIPPEISGLLKNPLLPSFSQTAHFFADSFGLDYVQASFLFKFLYVTACVTLAAGFLSRFSALTLLGLHLILVKGSYFYSYGVDCFTTIALFYCILFPLGSQFSLDSFFLRKRVQSPVPFRRILQVHLCFVYFFSGFDKLMGFNWHNGEAIWKAVHLPYFNQDFTLSINHLSAYPSIFVFIGWATLLVELLYPFFIFWNRTRALWLTLVVLLHVGILIFLNLYFFATLMIILNLSAFMDLSSSPAPLAEMSWLKRMTSLFSLKKAA